MATTPQWKLYRLAPRAIEVVGMHKQRHTSVAVYEPSLIPAAERLIVAYRGARGFEATRATEQSQGKAAVATLHTKLRAWVGIVNKHFDDFDVQAYGARPEVPEDVIHDAIDLMEMVTNQEALSEATFLTQMQEDLGSAIEVAKKEWGEATAAGTAYANLQVEVRDAAAAFQIELVALRRTLMAVLGRGHRDYRRLRATRVRNGVEEEDEVDEHGADVDGVVEVDDSDASVKPVQEVAE